MRTRHYLLVLFSLALTCLALRHIVSQAQEPRIIVSGADTVRQLDSEPAPVDFDLNAKITLHGANTGRSIVLISPGSPGSVAAPAQSRIILHGANTNRVINLIPPAILSLTSSLSATNAPTDTSTPPPLPTATDTPTATSTPTPSPSETGTPTATTSPTTPPAAPRSDAAPTLPSDEAESTKQDGPNDGSTAWQIVIWVAIIGAAATIAAAVIGMLGRILAARTKPVSSPLQHASDEQVSGKQITYNIPNIRKLMLEAFTAQDLYRFCQDRPSFSRLIDQFGTKYSLADMVDEVIAYCRTHHLWEELLQSLEQENPKQYQRYKDQLRSP